MSKIKSIHLQSSSISFSGLLDLDGADIVHTLWNVIQSTSNRRSRRISSTKTMEPPILTVAWETIGGRILN